MHSPYLKHLRERPEDGSCHASAVKQNLCRLPCLHNCIHRHTVATVPRSSCLFQCHCQHNCCFLYSKCPRSNCPSWLSSISVIFQTHLRASCLRLCLCSSKCWLPSCTKILLTVTLNYSVQKHTEQHTPDIYNYEK